MNNDFVINYAFICDDVRTEVGGKFSYIGQSDVVMSPVLPFVVPKAFVVYACRGPIGKYTVSTTITNIDSGEIVVSIPKHVIEIKKIDQAIREVYALHNIKYENEGKYLVEVFYNEEELLNFSYLVKKVDIKKHPNSGVGELPIKLSSN